MTITFPWVGNYDQGVPREIGPVSGTLPQLLLQSAQKSPQAPGVDLFGENPDLSGPCPNRRRGWPRPWKTWAWPRESGSRSSFPTAPSWRRYHAILSLGGVAVLLNPLLSPQEIAHQLEDSGTRSLVVLDHLLPKVEAAARDAGSSTSSSPA